MPEPFTPLQTAIIVIGFFIITLISLFLLMRLRRLPRSIYATGIRSACVLTIISIIFTEIRILTPYTNTTAIVVINSLSLNGSITSFMLANIAFLRIIAPFVVAIPPKWISTCLGVALVIGTVNLVVAAYPLAPPEVQVPMRLFGAAYSGLAGALDIMQQIFLLNFVLRKLKSSPTRFRVAYASVIVVGCAIAIASMITWVVNLDPSESLYWRMLTNLGISAFGLCSLTCLEMLRAALLRPKIVPQQDTNANLLAKQGNSKKMPSYQNQMQQIKDNQNLATINQDHVSELTSHTGASYHHSLRSSLNRGDGSSKSNSKSPSYLIPPGTNPATAVIAAVSNQIKRYRNFGHINKSGSSGRGYNQYDRDGNDVDSRDVLGSWTDSDLGISQHDYRNNDYKTNISHEVHYETSGEYLNDQNAQHRNDHFRCFSDGDVDYRNEMHNDYILYRHNMDTTVQDTDVAKTDDVYRDQHRRQASSDDLRTKILAIRNENRNKPKNQNVIVDTRNPNK